MILVLLALAVGLFAMLMVGYLAHIVNREPPGTDEMIRVANYIIESADAFIRRMYKSIAIFVVLMMILLALIFRSFVILGVFFLGVFLSLTAAFIGLHVAVKAGLKTVSAARTSTERAFIIAFYGGAVMGLSVIGLSLIGAGILFLLLRNPQMFVGFGFGVSLAALFAQLGGGIFTKAADIGADLVGKIEQRIPEDDPRNPAAIADLVGDNVGDCAGRGADIFESISDDYITAMILGSMLIGSLGENVLVYPLVVGAAGVLATILGLYAVKLLRKRKPNIAFNITLITTAALCIVGAYLCAVALLNNITVFYAMLSGLLVTLAVGLVVQYYTGIGRGPVKVMAETSKRGAALNIITGLAYALQTPFFPIVLVLASALFSYFICNVPLYGIVAANIGTDLLAGIIMSSDTFGPICDNAAGIAEMAKVRTKNGLALAELDALGNTTKAYTKAYASTSCTISTIVLFLTYGELAGLRQAVASLLDPKIIAGLILGATVPFIFSSMAIGAVSKTAYKIVDEARRQFREKPAILEGKAKPNYARCVDIGTKNALKNMITPTVLTLISPIIIGFILGKYALGAMLLGSLATSALLAPMFTMGGGLWDNAKKYVERRFWMKGTPLHEAVVTGDTVGDPLKDTAGPSLNIFMKLMNMTALLILPFLVMA